MYITRYNSISFRHPTIPICISNATTPHQRTVKATIWVLAHCYGGSSNPNVALKHPNYNQNPYQIPQTKFEFHVFVVLLLFRVLPFASSKSPTI